MIEILVNNSTVEAMEGESLLSALRRSGIKIPTLCYMKNFSTSGACRLCVVEVEGKRDLVTSCSYPVESGMVVKTNSKRVIKARKTLVEMLLSNHPDDCLYCERNGNCELQWLAEEMHIKERNFFSAKNTHNRDHSSPSVFRDPAKCILCNRCVRVCEEEQKVTAIEFISRGNKTTVNSAFDKGLNVSSCINCGQCIMVCPTGALVDVSHIDKVQNNISKKNKEAWAYISPVFYASIADHFGIKAADNPAGKIATALGKMGFSKVFDMGHAYDLNIVCEADLLHKRIIEQKESPLLSSCCPAWIKYAEEFQVPNLVDVSKIKSPQQIMGVWGKFYQAPHWKKNPENIYAVSFMPCVANKFEAVREEMTSKGVSEIDAVISIREFLRMLRSHGMDLRNKNPIDLDEPFNQSAANALSFTYSGGKAEAVAKQLYYIMEGNIKGFKFVPPKNPGSKKEVKVQMGKYEIGFAWVSGIMEAQNYLDELREQKRTDIHYVEVMACTHGCTNGGGQPIDRYPERHKLRKKTTQDLEKYNQLSYAGENPEVQSFLQKANENAENDFKIKDKLFTRYYKRDFVK